MWIWIGVMAAAALGFFLILLLIKLVFSH